MIKKWKTLHPKLNHQLHTVHNIGHTLFHIMYLGLVSIESHGYYGKAAFGMLCIIMLGLFTGENES